MATWLLLMALVANPPETSADAVTLRDGRVVLGQVIEPSPRGKLLIIVRRSWVREHLADLAKRWEAAEAPVIKKSRDQRKARLVDWRRERPKLADSKEDAIGDWLDREIERLKNPQAADQASRLMVVSLSRGDAKGISRANPRSERLLRLAWVLNLDDAESQSTADLKSAIEGRGRLTTGNEPISLDEYLPMPAEDEARWRLRRAATEVGFEPGLRFIRFQDLVLPEGSNPVAEGLGMEAIGGLVKGLLGEAPAEDPLAIKLKEVASRKRAGAMVTRLAIGDDGSSMSVEATLWVRIQGDRWEPAISRSSDSRTLDARADEAEAVGSDPRVKAILGGVEALGLGNLAPQLKGAGASAKRAIGEARSALQKDLDALALPVASAP